MPLSFANKNSEKHVFPVNLIIVIVCGDLVLR